MAYTWEWKNKCGEFSYNGGTCNLYEGNGFLIGINEWKEGDEDKYNVAWFFVDKQHAKRCLGLEKGSYDMFEGLVEKIVLYKDKCRNWKDIIDLFTKTQPNVVVEILPTERKVAEE